MWVSESAGLWLRGPAKCESDQVPEKVQTGRWFVWRWADFSKTPYKMFYRKIKMGPRTPSHTRAPAKSAGGIEREEKKKSPTHSRPLEIAAPTAAHVASSAAPGVCKRPTAPTALLQALAHALLGGPSGSSGRSPSG